MGENMVKGHTLGLMEESMKGSSRMEKEEVKEHSLLLKETSM